MPDNNSDERQRIFPMLAYNDAPAAIDFLCKAFGFTERERMQMPDGKIGHAEVVLHGNVVMLATTWKEAGIASPQDIPGVTSQLYCDVDDVDAHYDRAMEAGAILIDTPKDQPYGMRMYRAIDLEGHHWLFGSKLK